MNLTMMMAIQMSAKLYLHYSTLAKHDGYYHKHGSQKGAG